MALTALARRLRRSARARRLVLGSVLLGTALAVLVWMVRLPIYDYPGGLHGAIVHAQDPGRMLLAINGYDSYLYDGSVAGELFRPGPLTLLAFAGANAVLIGAFAACAGAVLRLSRRTRDTGVAGAEM